MKEDTTEKCVCGRVCTVQYIKEHRLHCDVRKKLIANMPRKKQPKCGLLRTKATQETINNFLLGDG